MAKVEQVLNLEPQHELKFRGKPRRPAGLGQRAGPGRPPAAAPTAPERRSRVGGDAALGLVRRRGRGGTGARRASPPPVPRRPCGPCAEPRPAPPPHPSRAPRLRGTCHLGHSNFARVCGFPSRTNHRPPLALQGPLLLLTRFWQMSLARAIVGHTTDICLSHHCFAVTVALLPAQSH